jgi:hypothetical protein
LSSKLHFAGREDEDEDEHKNNASLRLPPFGHELRAERLRA